MKRGVTVKQIMGDLPSYRYDASAPAWLTCLMDLFGPMEVLDTVKKRTKMKVWGVLYRCALTRAIQLDVAVDASTDSVLHTLRRLIARRGDVWHIVSDPSSQLRGASNELKRWIKGWSHSELIRFGATNKLEWSFIMADSQHQNASAESLVKVAKGVIKSMMKSIGTTVLSLDELYALLEECSNLVNERPICVRLRPNAQTDTDFLSPNSLLLGHSSEHVTARTLVRQDQDF